MTDRRTAVVDVGSNTIRLVIFTCDEYFNVSELQNIKVPARLVQYLENKVMSEEGIQVLLTILKNFHEIIARFDVQDCYVVATAAVRQSENVEEIVNRVHDETDMTLDVLSEDEEAFYGNYAVRHTMKARNGITIDIGGGSTELVRFENKQVVDTISLPFGGVSLYEQFFEGKAHNDEKALKKARKWINKQISEVEWVEGSGLPIIGIGGSVRNVAEVYQRQINYPIAGMHEFYLHLEELESVCNLFTSLTMDELEDLDGLSSERRDTITPATLVFIELLNVAQSQYMIVSQRGLREGILIKHLNDEETSPYDMYNIRSQNVVKTARKYRISSLAVNQRIIIVDNLLSELERNSILKLTPEQLQIMYYGSTLYYIGAYIEDDARSQHSFYILSNMNLGGFNHKERVAMALIASFKNKSLFKQYVEDFESWFTKEEYDLLMHLGGITKFAEALNDAQVNRVESIELIPIADGNYELHLAYRGPVISEVYRANKQKNHFERLIDGDLHIIFDTNISGA